MKILKNILKLNITVFAVNLLLNILLFLKMSFGEAPMANPLFYVQ